MLALVLWFGLALTELPLQEPGESEFVVLHRASEPERRADGVFAVGLESGRFDVLARGRLVASLALAQDATVTSVDPNAARAEPLRPNEGWVVSPRWTRYGVVEVAGDRDQRTTTVTVPEQLQLSVPGVHSARLTEARDRVLFQEVGQGADGPRRVQLVDAQQGGLLDFTVEGAVAIRVSADGGTVVVGGATELRVHRPGRETRSLPPARAFHLTADGGRLVRSDRNGVFVVDLGLPPRSPRIELSKRGGLVAAADAGDHLLVIYADAAELYDLAASTDRRLWRREAPQGARFVSCDLRMTEQGPRAALGSRRKILPQLEPAGLGAPARAEAGVVVLAAQGPALVEHAFETGSWEGDQPRVHWTESGRLLVVTREHVLVSQGVLD